MIGEQQDKRIHCPYCGEPISVLVDTSVAEQSYIEDCSVCCRPIELQVWITDGDAFVQARAEGD